MYNLVPHSFILFLGKFTFTAPRPFVKTHLLTSILSDNTLGPKENSIKLDRSVHLIEYQPIIFTGTINNTNKNQKPKISDKVQTHKNVLSIWFTYSQGRVRVDFFNWKVDHFKQHTNLQVILRVAILDKYFCGL